MDSPVQTTSRPHAWYPLWSVRACFNLCCVFCRALELSYNSLIPGPIPDFLSGLTAMTYVTSAGRCTLSRGSCADLPHVACGCVVVRRACSSCALCAIFPPGRLFKCHGCGLTGVLPSTIGAWTQLRCVASRAYQRGADTHTITPLSLSPGCLFCFLYSALDLGINSITGPIPDTIGDLTKLT